MMGRQLVNKIRGKNSLTAKGVLLLWAFLLSFACLVTPHTAEAAVTALTGNDWRATSGTAISATTYFRGTTAAPGATNTYAIAAGPNRLLVVALVINTSTAQNTRIPTVKYGAAGAENKTLTLATSDQGTSQRQHTWLFYLKEADIATANGTNLSFTYAGTTPTYTGTYANAAVYQNVDQTTPILTPTTYSNSTLNSTVGPLATSQVVATGDIAVEVVNALNTAAGTAPTLTSDTSPSTWTLVANTTRTSTTAPIYGMRASIATNANAGTHDSTHTLTGVTAIDSMSAMTLKAGAVDTTKPTVTAFTAPATSDTVTISPITFTASDDSGTVAGYLINESATPPAASAITSTTAPTSYSVTSGGTKTLYAWVKDPSGNVSAAYAPQTVVVTVPSAPARSGSWTQTYASATYPNGAAGSFTVPAGSNRLLVVAIATTRTAIGSQTISNVTWGGKTLTLASTNASDTTVWNHTALFYLKEADIASASGTALTATVSGGTSYYTYVYAAVYTGVDQVSPVPSAASFASATASTSVGPFSPTLTVDAFHQAVEVVNLSRSTAGTTGRTISTWATGWTTAGVAPTAIVTSGPTLQLYIRDRAIPTTLTNDGSQHTASSTASYRSMTALSLKYASSGVNLTTGSSVPNKSVYAGDLSVPVDAFTLQTTVADTVTSIQVTGSAASNNTNVAKLKIYRKVGTNPAIYETGDVEIANVSNPFAGGTVANIGVSEAFTGADARNYIIVYDIAATAAPSSTNTLSATVTAITVTNPGTLSDTPTAGTGVITIYPTTTIANGVDSALPTPRLYKSSALTKLDEFILSHNSAQVTDNDTISTVTVTLTPAGISGGGAVLSKVARVEVVSADGNTVYGFMTAPTTGDIWNIPTPSLVATSSPTTYYIRISTPANIVDGLYTVAGTITSVVHSKGTSKLVNDDKNSQTLIIDVEAPIGPTSLTATTTAPEVQPGGKIDLSWNTAYDPNGGSLHPTTPYIVKRSVAGGVDPAAFCTDGDTVPINQGATTFTDAGLNDTSAPIYHYRICAIDSLGNVSAGTTAAVASSYTNYCDKTPDVTLGVLDPVLEAQVPPVYAIQDQLVKSVGGNPFNLQITNNDIGDCPNVDFNIALVETSTTGGSCVKCDATDPPPSLADFTTTYPATVTLGKRINKTSSTESIYVNGQSTADQIQKYLFKVQVSATGHAPVTTLQATAILNDMPPIVHNANNMGKYQYGNWGNNFTCATCHSNSTTNIKGVYQVISTTIGKRNVVFKTTSGNSSTTDGYSNDQRTNKTVSNNVCSVCHHRTRQHQYSANKANGGPNNDVPYTSDHHNNRDCVKCHTHNTAFRSILGVCGDCHGFKGTQYAPVNKATMVKQLTNALGTSPPSYGAHARHNMAKMQCAVCHNNTNHGLPTHSEWLGDDKLEIGFQIDNTTFPGFNPAATKTGGYFEGTNSLNAPYVWTPGPGTTITLVNDSNASCSTYCHGAWNGNQGSNTKPNWVGTGQAACGTCHYATPVTPPTSGSHAMHAGTGVVRSGVTGLGIACSKCHSTYASYTGSAHINGNVEWNLSQISPSALYNGSNASSTGASAPTNSASYSTCTNLYCHSNVQGDGGVGNPSIYAAPKWGDNNVTTNTDSATAYCGSCHEFPNTVGGHEQHESLEFAFDCHVCHNNGGRTTPASHADGKINFQFVGLGANTVYKGISSVGGSVTPQLGYGACSNSDCHGRYTRTWGPPTSTVLCEKCHGSSNSARGFYNTRGPDGTLSIYSAAIGVHDIHLQNPNSPRKATFSRFTSFAAGMSCNQCHYNPTGPFSPGHMDTALPAEVPFAHMSSIAHNGESFGYYSTPTYNFGTNTCNSVWCHGAGMQSNTAVATGKYKDKARYNPVVPKWNEPLLASGDVCIKCHAMPPAASSSADTHWNVGAGRVYARNECISCHQHVNEQGNGFSNKSLHINGKIDGGCTGCHGDPPTTGDIGTETGLASPVQNAMSSSRPGAHDKHVKNVNILKNCYTCHNNYNPLMPSDKLEIGFNGLGGKVTSGTFTAYSSPDGGANWMSSSAGTNVTVVANRASANVCSNVYCHGSTITDAGTNKTPNWEQADQAVCGTCHGADPSSVPFPALNGAHTRHASNAAGGLQLACGTCHGSSAQSMAHVDGKVEWELDQNNPKIGTTARYRNLSTGTTGSTAPSASYGQCTNFYCHSNVQGAGGIGAPTVYNTMTWGASTTLNCGSCHMTQVGTGTGSHPAHTALYGGTSSCGYCHHDGGNNTELHADGMIYVNITTSRKGAGTYSGFNRDAGSATGYGSCSNVICHGGATIKWGTNLGSYQCQKCHGSKTTAFTTTTSAQVAPGYGTDGQDTAGNTAATAPKVGAHQRHLSSNAITTRVKCSECHVKVTNVLDNGHLNYTTATITFTGRAVANLDPATAARNASGVITCSTAWCHTAKYNTGTKLVPVWNDTGYLNETGTTLADCVSCHAIPPKGVGITDHETITTSLTDSISTLGAKCSSCHTNVKASPTNVSDVFVDKSQHVNGSVEGGSCLGCHASVKNGRAAAAAQFGYQSHHIQGAESLTTAQCFQCHMEADASGNTTSYHGKSAASTVDLVVWASGSRGTSYISYTANGNRKQIAKLNTHCLSCHNAANATQAPFGTFQTTAYSPEPKMVPALNKTSILSRYSSTRTVAWSNYSFTNSSGQIRQYGTNKKNNISKALSAHGNAINNKIPKWSVTANGPGADEPLASDDIAAAGLGANRNVLCFDCHNSHGSDASGITSSYSSATGRYKGGLLKSTVAGQGGYTVTYKPATRNVTYRNVSSLGQTTATTTVATFNPGASICNDCHNNNDASKGINITKPWSLMGTYSSTQAIVGYWSTPYFDNYTFNSAKRYVYKAGGTVGAINDRRKPMGGHYGSSVSSRSASHSGEINGLCTPCHDPHGVSGSMTTVNRGKSVPLLKGTWVTSPYREDAATPVVKRGGGRNFTGVAAMGAMPGYNIDQNTLINLPAVTAGGAATTTTASNKRAQYFTTFPGAAGNALALHTEKTPADFAGLCVGCHNQASLTNATAPSATNWKSKERVHQSVAGWAATTGTNANGTVHAYTCSKCHAPHVSRLPRLMVTNCLDVRHTKQVVSGGSIVTTPPGTPGFAYGNVLQSYASSAYGAGRFPAGGGRYSGTPTSAQNNGPWYFQTTVPTAATYGSNCHNATNAGGATYNPTTQIWNKKTVW